MNKPDWSYHRSTGDCPYCGREASDLAYGPPDCSDSDEFYQTVICPQCGHSWTLGYTVTHIYDEQDNQVPEGEST